MTLKGFPTLGKSSCVHLCPCLSLKLVLHLMPFHSLIFSFLMWALAHVDQQVKQKNGFWISRLSGKPLCFNESLLGNQLGRCTSVKFNQLRSWPINPSLLFHSMKCQPTHQGEVDNRMI